MRRSIVLLGIVGMLVLVLAVPAFAARGTRETGRGTGLTVLVTGQDLVYDSIVTADPLPWNGQDNWQLLTADNTNRATASTQFGPGDVGYFGGRWYEDTDGTPGPSAEDHFFLCPLLGPGRN